MTGNFKTLACTLFLLCSAPAFAQEVSDEAPLAIAPRGTSNATVLPANTEVLLAMNDTITTKGDNLKEGSTFSLSVVHDVMMGDYVIIPAGARAMGEVTWLTSKGAFGKSGKMDVSIKYVEVGGRRVPLTGTYRQEGEGNTVATVGGVIAAGPFAAFITGKSGVIPQGRELMARTKNDLPVQLSGPAPVAAPLVVNQKAVEAPVPAIIPAATTAEQPPQ